jgi:hypothetical protein
MHLRMGLVGCFFMFSLLACQSRTSQTKSSASPNESSTGAVSDRFCNLEGLEHLKILDTAEPPQGFLEKCGSKMTKNQYRELLSLTDTNTFLDYREAAPRAECIAKIFAQAGPEPSAGKGDRRGIFASMYVEITKESVGSNVRGEYTYGELSQKLVKRFAERYFEPLHDHLIAKKAIDQWQEYYDLANKCDTSDLRILGTGVNTHMSYDLAHSLKEIKAHKDFEEDFMKFGDILIQKKRVSTNLLQSQQNVYAASFFDLFLPGKIIDSILETGTAATLGFQLIRAEAWKFGQDLQVKEKERFTSNAMAEAWQNRQFILSLMPHSHSEMKGTEAK